MALARLKVWLVRRPLEVKRIVVPRTASVLARELKPLLIGNLWNLDENLRTLMRVPGHSHNLLHRIQAKKIGNRVLRKGILLKKKLEKSLDQKMEMMIVTKMRKGRVKRKKKKKNKKGRVKRRIYASKWSKKEDHVIRALVVRLKVPHQGTCLSKGQQRVKRAVDVVVAWKALSPSEGDRAFALKMADHVLKHLTANGASSPSGTPTSGATESQRPSNPGDGASLRRKKKEPATSKRPAKNFNR
ncbi:hypothetical protein Scep_009972 [Stephania cephalantha]|uniref:Uncharacterized protein n=1 Tax=Stephania cephalantha TaxID=152367 RepID=A0AAP0PGS4_9MAGN